MRETQAVVKTHDEFARRNRLLLPEVRYDLQYSSAAMWHSGNEVPWNVIRLGRSWLTRKHMRFALQVEEAIDTRTVARLESAVPTTCGGFICD